MKLISRTMPFLLVLLFSAGIAHAQSATVLFGLGTATDKASNAAPVDTFGDGNFYSTPKMAGLFGTFGASFMIKPHFGVGGEYSFRTSQGTYAALNYRPGFYDFNGIYEPMSEKDKIVPEFQVGLGGANLKFYAPSTCDQFAGCSSSSYLESSNHFQLHASAGVRFYVKGGLFVRPQVDIRWVNNFFQFGSSIVPQYTVAIGYTLGGR